MNTYTYVIVAFILGFISGIVTALMMRKQNKQTDRIISLLIVGLWTSFHTIAFFLPELTVAWAFDVLGAGAAAHICGLDAGELISRLRSK